MAVVLQRLGGARDRASAFRGAVGPIPPVTESGPRRTPPQGASLPRPEDRDTHGPWRLRGCRRRR